MRIVDAHHHVWRQRDLPWLLGPMRPRIFGPYEPIRRDHPIAEYLADVEGTGVEASVYVQANWAPDWAADETAWVEAVAAASGWPHAIVGYADLTAPDADRALDRLEAASPRMRGIRQRLHWHVNPLYRFAPRLDLAADPTPRRNAARLAERGWVFELQIFHPQTEHALGLVDACPDTVFVPQHALMPEDPSEGGLAAWRAALGRLAERPNVRAKLSGLGTFVHRVEPAQVRRIVGETLDAFGPERCLWGSNFPAEKLWTDYAGPLAAHREATADLAEAERDAIFRATAARTYRLEEAGPRAPTDAETAPPGGPGSGRGPGSALGSGARREDGGARETGAREATQGRREWRLRST